MNKLNLAVSIACRAHQNQVRKNSGLPYLYHPMEVMRWLHDMDVEDQDILCAALLHDTIEDNPHGDFDLEIESKFNPRVLSIVKELTFIGGDKTTYLNSFMKSSYEALLIKVIDRSCNVRDFGMISGNKYAAEYWTKSLPVFDAFYDRRKELCLKTSRHTTYLAHKFILDSRPLFKTFSIAGYEHSRENFLREMPLPNGLKFEEPDVY